MAVWSEVTKSELGPRFRLDAEYYQPELLKMLKRVRERGASALGPSHARIRKTKFIPKDGSSFDYIEISRVSTSLGTYDTIEMPDVAAPSRAQYVVKPGDVLVSEVRPNRSAIALVPNGIGRTVCSSGFAVVEPVSVSSEYLFAYFKTKWITDLLARDTTATMYPAVCDDDIVRLPFIQPEERFERIVMNKVREAFLNLASSKDYYAQAKGLFLTELGIGDLDLSPTLFYERRYSEACAAVRFDAEYFMPKYKKVLDALKKAKPLRIAPLGDLLFSLTNGHTPLHHDLSIGDVPFLTAEHIFDFRIEYDSDKRILLEHHQGELKGTQLRKGDFLITIKGRIGNAAIAEGFNGPVNINQDVALFRLKDDLPPYYLVAFLNSPAGKAFTEQYSTGQINPFLGLGNLRLLPIPIYDEKCMDRIARKTQEAVLAARAARDESRRLLEDAKRMVEEAILMGVK